MTPSSRELFAHLALALGRYVKELRRDGVVPPPALLAWLAFVTDCARTRQDASRDAVALDPPEGGAVTRYATLTKREAAAELRMSVRSLERLLADSSVPLASVRVEGAVRIRRADLDAYIEGLGPRSFREQIREKTA